jgi:hypothetical protein
MAGMAGEALALTLAFATGWDQTGCRATPPREQILGNLSQEAQDAAWAEMENRLSAFQSPGGWEGPNELLVARGTRLSS